MYCMIKFHYWKAYVGQRALKQQISKHKTAIRTGNMEYAIVENYGSPATQNFTGLDNK